MGFFQKLKSFFSSSDQPVKSALTVTIDTYSPVEELLSTKQMRSLSSLTINGPARGGKGAEMLAFVKSICKKYNILKSVDLSGVMGLDEVPYGALSDCECLNSVLLPDGVRIIQNDAFKNCKNLSLVQLPEGLERIYESAFENCAKLPSITLPKTLFRIGKDVFMGCDSLTRLVVPCRVESIGVGAFNCRNLAELEVAPNNPSYISVDNIIYSRNGSALVKYASGKPEEEYEVPAQVAKICEEAFYGCVNLKKIILPKNASIIDKRAFKLSESLAELETPSRVEKLGDEAFYGCRKLASVSLSEGLATIGGGCFKNCQELRSVKLPHSLLKVGDEAFANCSKLSGVVLPTAADYMGKDVLKGTLCEG